MMSGSRPMWRKSAWIPSRPRPAGWENERKMKKYSKSHHGTMHELNITPLLDLAFVLLVIFIITTTPMVNDLDLNLPTRNPAPKAAPQKTTYIIDEPDGRIFLHPHPVDPPAVQPQPDAPTSHTPQPAL